MGVAGESKGGLRAALQMHKARLQQPGGHKSKQEAVTTPIPTHTQTHTQTPTRAKPTGPPHRASRLHSGRFFPSHPNPQNFGTRHHQERYRKAESEVDPGTANPRPTQAS